MSDQTSNPPVVVQFDASSVQQLLAAQQAQIAELTNRMLQLTELIANRPAPETTVRPSVQQAAPAQAELASSAVPGFEAETYYVRIKPYNKPRKHGRRNQFFKELGRLLRGGTGQAGSIPEWAGPVSREVAIAISQYRQRPSDPYSEPVCDVVTAEEKESIDGAEVQYRAAALGLAGISPQQILSHMQRAGGQLNARTAAPVAPRPRPSTVQGAQVYQQAQAAAGLAQVQRIAPPAMAGRAAALANLTAPPAPPVAPVASAPAAMIQPAPSAPPALPSLPPMPDLADLPPPPPSTTQVLSERNVSEDLTREARADVSAEAAVAAAEKYVPSLSTGASRMRPKGQ